MEVLAPLALAAAGGWAANNMKPASNRPKTLKVQTGGKKNADPSVTLVFKEDAPAEAKGTPMRQDAPGMPVVPPSQGQEAFDPVMAHFQANAQPGRMDNLQPLRTVYRDPKYALTPQSGSEYQYDQQNRGTSELENQWYYGRLTKDTETPLSMGFLPEYKRSTGVMLRDNDGPNVLKPQKRELLEEEVWAAQPDQLRNRYDPILQEQSRRARNESKYGAGNGALDNFAPHDRPGGLGGAWVGWSTGERPTRQWTGFHPQQRMFRADDNQRQRNPHGLRALNKNTDKYEMRADMQGNYSNDKKQQLSNYHQIAVADGGRQHPHLPVGMRHVQLKYTARDSAPEFSNVVDGGSNSGGPNGRGLPSSEWQRRY